LFPYWIMFSVFAVGAVQYRPAWRRIQGGPLFILSCFLTTLLIGLRYQVGGDWLSYEQIFESLASFDFVQTLLYQDPGYAVINWIVGRIGFEIWAVNLICGALFMWGLTKFARLQPNPWLTMLVAVPYLIIVVAMGYTRQAVAIGFVLALISEIEAGSIIRLGFYAVLAAAFHKSSIVVLPFVALTATRGRVSTTIVILLTLPILYYAFLQASVDKLVTNYIDAEYNSQGAAIRVAMNIPPALVFLLSKRRFMLSPVSQKLWRNFSLAALLALAMLIFTPSSTAVDRLALYIIPLQLFVLGRMPWAFPQEGAANRLLLFGIVLYSAAIELTWLNFADNVTYWLPYRLYPL
jgi:hypothetical protein